MRTGMRLSGALLAFACVLAGTAGAAPTRIPFSGVVTGNKPFASTPAIGSPIAGSFTIDPAFVFGEGPNCRGIPKCWSGTATSWVWNGLTISPASPSILLVRACTRSGSRRPTASRG